jgi:probable FeS assembly SUF system protein SufT
MESTRGSRSGSTCADMPRLIRACPATAVPAGTQVTLPAGLEVDVMQTLGGNVTVRSDEGLFRIGGENADAVEGFQAESSPAGASEQATFNEEAVWSALRTCFDPEIPVNIVDLGLVYDLSVEKTPAGAHAVEVKMTLTAQGCGMGPVIAEDARRKISSLPTVESAQVHIVWDPVWTPHMISAEGRKTLGLE